MYTVELIDLAAVAFITVLPGRRFLTYRELERVGHRAVELLRVKGCAAVLVLGRAYTDDLLRERREFFIEDGQADAQGLRLRADRTVEQLIDAFIGYLAVDVLAALCAAASTVLAGEPAQRC